MYEVIYKSLKTCLKFKKYIYIFVLFKGIFLTLTIFLIENVSSPEAYTREQL